MKNTALLLLLTWFSLPTTPLTADSRTGSAYAPSSGAWSAPSPSFGEPVPANKGVRIEFVEAGKDMTSPAPPKKKNESEQRKT